MAHDLAALDDRRWRAMTNDEGAVPGKGFGHLSCARRACHRRPQTEVMRSQSAVMRHRATWMFHAMRVARSAMDN